MTRRRPKQTFECPNCGAEVVVGKKVCRECGSDASTGWQSSEEIDYQSIDIPDGYGPDGFGPHGGGQGAAGRELPPASQARWVTVVAIVLVAAMVAWTLLGYW